MAAYKERKFSLVKFCRDSAAEIATDLGVTAPVFVDLDAHANMSTMPSSDFIGIVGFSMHVSGNMLTVFAGIVVSAFNDVDLVRHTEMADIMLNKLQPTKQVPVYLAGDTIKASGFMVITDGVILEPISKTDTRSLQVINVQFLNDHSAGSGS